MSVTSPESPVRYWRRQSWDRNLSVKPNSAGCINAPLGIIRFLAQRMLKHEANSVQDPEIHEPLPPSETPGNGNGDHPDQLDEEPVRGVFEPQPILDA